MEENDAQYVRMTKEPIYKLIPALAVPTIISMLVTAIYNTADTYFVSQLGKSASGAVGIVFSLMAIIQTVGFTIGMGSGSHISRLLGKKENEQADKVASSAIVNAMVMGLAMAVIGVLYTKPIMKMLGATDTILPYAVDYAKYIFIAAPIMINSFVCNNLLRSEGKAKFSMFGILSGGILNIVLDPIFIFKFDLGIAGAAIATAISQAVSLAVLLAPFIMKKTVLHLSIKNVSIKVGTYIGIIKYGMPSFFRQGLASIASVLLNLEARNYGDSAIAAMSIVSKIFMMIFCLMIGFGQAYQPVVGYNFGSGNQKRVREAFWFTLKVGTITMTILGTLTFIFTPELIGIFLKNDAEVLAVGTFALRIQCAVMPIMTLGIVSNMTFQSVGKTKIATILSSCRQGIFFIPLILILPRIFGITGVEITQPIADIATFICCIPFIVKFIRGLSK